MVKVKVTHFYFHKVVSDSLQPHGILQARILQWVAVPFSRGSSQPRERTQVSHIAGGFFTSWATREAQISVGSIHKGDFPGGSVVKNLPWNAGDMGSIPSWGTKISHTEGQLSLWAKLESLCHSERPRMTQQRFLLPQLRPDAAKEI